MADDSTANRGPTLLILTDLLQKPKFEYASPTFKRVVPVRPFVYGTVGGLIGLMLSAIVVIPLHLGVIVLGWGIMVPAVAGALFYYFQPSSGDTLGTWLMSLVKHTRRSVAVGGKRASLYVDLAPLTKPEDGRYFIRPATVRVRLGTVDSQGLPVPPDDENS